MIKLRKNGVCNNRTKEPRLYDHGGVKSPKYVSLTRNDTNHLGSNRPTVRFSI